ncbi:MAG: hypothetical protein AAFX86_02065 [Pseudomonadota bacterium]
MEAETVRRIISYLMGIYAFVATMWAIALPAIKENEGLGARQLQATLRVIAAALLILFIGQAFVGAADSSETADVSIAESAIILSILIATIVVAATIDNVFYKLSKPAKPKASDELTL